MHIAKHAKGNSKKLQRWYLHSVLKKFDMFGKPLPTFNLKGQISVHTMAGGLLTFAIMIVILIYSTIKLI